MKCMNCGIENEQDFEYCPNCGASSQPAPISLNPAEDKILGALKDNLFLVICILLSASSVISIISGSFPLLAILVDIFLWLVYAQSRKNIADVRYLRCLSGTVFANCIIGYVIFGIMFFIGILLAFLMNIIASDPELFSAVSVELGAVNESLAGLSEILLSSIGWIVGLVFALGAVGGVLTIVFGMRKIHQLAKSTYQSIDSNTLNFEKANASKNWLIVFGVITAVTAISSLMGGEIIIGIGGVCNTVATILSGVLIHKYLLS